MAGGTSRNQLEISLGQFPEFPLQHVLRDVYVGSFRVVQGNHFPTPTPQNFGD